MVIGGILYLLYLSNLKPKEAILVGADRDAHGCIGSAGYSWCEPKQKCLRIWEEKCEPDQIKSINLISPNGGEEWKTGETHLIKWSSENIPKEYKISIHLRRVPPPPLQKEGQEFDPIAFINLENNGSTTWKISDMYPTGNYLMEIVSYPSIPITTTTSDESSSTFKIISSKK
jgi:hypothetical protein